MRLLGRISCPLYAADRERSRHFLEEALGSAPEGQTGFEVRGERQGSFYAYDRAPDTGFGGVGTVHHVAWASSMEDHRAWRERVVQAGATPRR